jgi:hypothetical protein
MQPSKMPWRRPPPSTRHCPTAPFGGVGADPIDDLKVPNERAGLLPDCHGLGHVDQPRLLPIQDAFVFPALKLLELVRRAFLLGG